MGDGQTSHRIVIEYSFAFNIFSPRRAIAIQKRTIPPGNLALMLDGWITFHFTLIAVSKIPQSSAVFISYSISNFISGLYNLSDTEEEALIDYRLES